MMIVQQIIDTINHKIMMSENSDVINELENLKREILFS